MYLAPSYNIVPTSNRPATRTRYHVKDGQIMSALDMAMCVSPMTDEIWSGDSYQPDIVNPVAQELYAQQATNVVSIDQNAITRRIVVESPRNTASVPIFSSLTVPYQLTELDRAVIAKLRDRYSSKKDGQKVTGANAEMDAQLKEIATKINIDTSAPPVVILSQVLAMSNNIRI